MMARNFSNMLKDTSIKFHMTNNQPASRHYKYRIICPLEKGEYLKKNKKKIWKAGRSNGEKKITFKWEEVSWTTTEMETRGMVSSRLKELTATSFIKSST